MKYTPTNEKEVAVFTIGDVQVTMDMDEYNNHLAIGETQPILIGDVLYMVTEADKRVLEDLNKRILELGRDKIDNQPDLIKTTKKRRKKQ